MPGRRTTLQCAAGYYALTGAAPFLSRQAFERVTGPKTDWWLVQMVGLLTMSIAAGIFTGLHEQREPRASVTLCCAAALSFAAIDVTYAAKRRISAVYLLDAAVESAILAMLLVTRR